MLLFLFQFPFCLWIKLSLFLRFPFAFILFSTVTHCRASFREISRIDCARPVECLVGSYCLSRGRLLLIQVLLEACEDTSNLIRPAKIGHSVGDGVVILEPQ